MCHMSSSARPSKMVWRDLTYHAVNFVISEHVQWQRGAGLAGVSEPQNNTETFPCTAYSNCLFLSRKRCRCHEISLGRHHRGRQRKLWIKVRSDILHLISGRIFVSHWQYMTKARVKMLPFCFFFKLLFRWHCSYNTSSYIPNVMTTS